jgi:hypothetical protein
MSKSKPGEQLPTQLQWLKNMIESVEGPHAHKALRSMLKDMIDECDDDDVCPIAKLALNHWVRQLHIGRN